MSRKFRKGSAGWLISDPRDVSWDCRVHSKMTSSLLSLAHGILDLPVSVSLFLPPPSPWFRLLTPWQPQSSRTSYKAAVVPGKCSQEHSQKLQKLLVTQPWKIQTALPPHSIGERRVIKPSPYSRKWELDSLDGKKKITINVCPTLIYHREQWIKQNGVSKWWVPNSGSNCQRGREWIQKA